MKIKKSHLEHVFLILFVTVFLLLGLSNVWSKELSHDFPYAYLASDAFFHQSVAQYMKEEGRVKYTPPYEVGGFEGVFDIHPPILSELSVVFSFTSGLETHDTIYLVVVFSVLLSILVVYLIIKQFNKNIAMLSLPITLLFFSKLFNMGLWWGIWHFLLSICFMLSVIWIITKMKLKHSWILLSLFFAGTIMTHPPETVFVFGFIIIFFIIEFITKKLNFKNVKMAFIGITVGTIIPIYYINLFVRTFLVSEGFRGTAAKGYFGFPDIFIQQLGYYGFIILAGAIIFLLIKKKTIVPGLIGIYMFLVSYLTYVGFGKRAFTHRFYWFIYLAFFFGLAVYYIIRILIKKWDIRYNFGLAVILLLFFAYPLNATTKVGNGIMEPYTWSGLKWISENTEEDAKIYYFVFPPDGLSQAAALYNSKRLAFKISYREVTKAIQENQLKSSYSFGLADSYPVYLMQESLFSYCYVTYALVSENNSVVCEKDHGRLSYPDPEKNICDIKYYYFNKFTRQEAFMQFNKIYRDALLKNDWITEVYSNELVSILKNQMPGVGCLVE